MTAPNAKEVAQKLGNIELPSDKLQAEIKRLNKKNIVTLKQVEVLHEWLEGKRQAKQSCRVVGESRTGKTIACNSYRLRGFCDRIFAYYCDRGMFFYDDRTLSQTIELNESK